MQQPNVNPNSFVAPITPKKAPPTQRGFLFAYTFSSRRFSEQPRKDEGPRLSPGPFGSFQTLDKVGGSFFQRLNVREIFLSEPLLFSRATRFPPCRLRVNAATNSGLNNRYFEATSLFFLSAFSWAFSIACTRRSTRSSSFCFIAFIESSRLSASSAL